MSHYWILQLGVWRSVAGIAFSISALYMLVVLVVLSRHLLQSSVLNSEVYYVALWSGWRGKTDGLTYNMQIYRKANKKRTTTFFQAGNK